MKPVDYFEKFLGSREKYTMEHRFLNIATIAGMFAALLSAYINWRGNYGVFSVLILIGIAIFLFYIYKKTLKDMKYERLYFLGIYFITFVYLPFTWFESGGIYGTVPLFFILQSMYIALFINKHKNIQKFGAMILLCITLMLIGYIFPNSVTLMPYGKDKYLEMSLAAIFVLIISYVIMSFVVKEYNWKQKQIEILSKENEQLANKLELAFLNAQIKPHFLFNSMNTIVSYCNEDSKKVSELLIALSKHLRGTLDMKNLKDMITLDKELEYVKAYIQLEQARFSKIEIVYDIEENLFVKIPPLIIQPLVENAIIHGLRKKGNSGVIILSIYETNEKCVISVMDNGVGIDKEKLKSILSIESSKESIGLYNITKRLERIYGKGLMIESALGEGTKVSFEVLKGEKNEGNSDR